MKKVFLLLLLVTLPVISQNYEVYTGFVVSEAKVMKPGYLIGANFIIKTNQNRGYLNNLLFGFEHSAFMSDNILYKTSSEVNFDATGNCNCDHQYIGLNTNKNLTLKKEVRAVSINLGVEVVKRWYLITGVTNLQHIELINSEKVNEYRSVQIDAGIKYFIKSNDWYFSPMVKFNPETISFSIGIAR